MAGTGCEVACAHPIPARRAVLGGVALARVHDLQRLGDVGWGRGEGELLLPCGSCLGCRQSRAREWAYRCQLESQQHGDLCWATLTYDEAHVPPTLSRRELQQYVKRLRLALRDADRDARREWWRDGQHGPWPQRRFRFFGCGEYGELRGRPHYHVMFFGLSQADEEMIVQAWQERGMVRVDPLTPAAIAYVAGYVSKKVGYQEEEEERVDRSTGEVYRYQPPFIQMSRKPGIGGYVRQWPHQWRDTAIYNGSRVPVPRLFHAAWRANASESQIVQLQQERESRRQGSVPSVYQLQAQEAISEARAGLSSLNRRLEQ